MLANIIFMKIILFVYDFPHKKSLKGMQLIKSYGLKDVVVISSPKIELKFRQSRNRIAVLENEIVQPTNLAAQYGWESLVASHNSDESISFLKKIQPDYGIILGSRILSKKVIECFSEGIINFHPGVLPENRGLDNLKWAIYKNIPQGVTTHFIDEKIDVGNKIFKEILEIEIDDTLFDINSKLLDLQLNHLNQLLLTNFTIENTVSLESSHISQKAVSDEIDSQIIKIFEDYKKQYSNILAKYKNI